MKLAVCFHCYVKKNRYLLHCWVIWHHAYITIYTIGRVVVHGSAIFHCHHQGFLKRKDQKRTVIQLIDGVLQPRPKNFILHFWFSGHYLQACRKTGGYNHYHNHYKPGGRWWPSRSQRPPKCYNTIIRISSLIWYFILMRMVYKAKFMNYHHHHHCHRHHQYIKEGSVPSLLLLLVRLGDRV